MLGRRAEGQRLARCNTAVVEHNFSDSTRTEAEKSGQVASKLPLENAFGACISNTAPQQTLGSVKIKGEIRST
jgi:hypothetical protein